MENEVPGERVLGGEDPLTVRTVELRHPLVDRVYVGLSKKIKLSASHRRKAINLCFLEVPSAVVWHFGGLSTFTCWYCVGYSSESGQ